MNIFFIFEKKVMNKQIIFLLALIILFIACNNSDNKTDTQLYDINKSSFIWRGDSLGNFYHSHSNILLPVEIDNSLTKSNIYFILNTGINNSFLFLDFARNSDKLSKDPNSEFFVDSIMEISGKIDEIKFGPVTFPVYDRYNNLQDSIIGQISLDFFSDNEILIDFTKHSISVSENFCIEDDCNFVKYKTYLDKKIIIPITADNKTYDFLLNPQSALYVAFNNSFNASEIKIGKFSFLSPENKNINNANPAFDGILGYAFLKNKKIIIRPNKQEICVINQEK